MWHFFLHPVKISDKSLPLLNSHAASCIVTFTRKNARFIFYQYFALDLNWFVCTNCLFLLSHASNLKLISGRIKRAHLKTCNTQCIKAFHRLKICCFTSLSHLNSYTFGHHQPVKWQICEQASNTLHRINRVKLFTENSAMARLRDTLKGWGPGDSQNILKRDSFHCLSQ